MLDNFIGIVLAAGKGTRLKANKINKVMLELAGKPMISYTLNLLEKVGFKKIIIVVGFKKQAVIDYFGNKYTYAYQRMRLGTAHAVKIALKKTFNNVKNIFVINADDSAFYPKKTIMEMINFHINQKADLTFLTVDMKKPNIARVLRNRKGDVVGVAELQNLQPGQEEIKEINCGCYCFTMDFLKKNLPRVRKNSVSNEYYLPELIAIGIKNKLNIQAFKMSKEDYFHSINTKDQLLKADKKMKKFIK